MPTGKKRKAPRAKAAEKLVDITTLLPGSKARSRNSTFKRKRNKSKMKVVFEPINGLSKDTAAFVKGSLADPNIEPGTTPNSGPGTGPNTGPGTAPGTGPGTSLMS